MPKGKKKGKYEHRRTEQAYSSDEDAGIDMTIDNCSETSAQSDLKSNHDDAGKLSGTQWGKKTGENRIIRTESIDTGLQHQAIKWKELDIKWSGPRPVNEKKVEPEPVKATPTYCYYPYQNSIEEEVKPDKLSLGSSLSPVAMNRPKSPRTVAIEQMDRDNRRWSKGQREYFISNYYMNCAALLACRALYSKKTLPEDATQLEVKCPNTSRIKRWVKDESRPKEQRKSEANKLSGTQWGRKTGENRITRTESIDNGLQHQEIKWRQLDIKWSGPRPVNEKKKIVEPVKEEPTYNNCYFPYQEPIEEEVKPDKLSLGSSLSPVAMKRPKSPRTVALEKVERDNYKLSGTQWGRKTGENRITRTESIDNGLQHQEIKWRQLDIKWSGPRPVNEKKKIVEPVKEEPNYNNYYYPYEEPIVEEVKPDKQTEIQEKFEEKVLEQIESLNARANAARAGAFVSLRASLQRRALDGLLTAHRATLADHVSRALRRGKDGERKAAAAIAPLLALQIGEEGEEEFVREVRPALTATATDKSASLDARTECCSSLAVLCYLLEDDLSEILEVMRMYETIFSGSYLKGDGSVKVSGAAVEEGAWHAAALDGWALLLPLLSPNHALSLLNNQAPSFARLGELLEAVSLEVRMAAGGALAIAYETVTDDDSSENPLTADVDVLLPRLTQLARDSHKFRAKRDRKIQRATFRDILKYFEEGEVSSMSVRIGSESASWSHWSGGAAYAALAGALGGALQVLAPRCARLRAALALSDVAPLASGPQKKLNKLQRHLQNNAANKARTVARNKNRDKRSAALAI